MNEFVAGVHNLQSYVGDIAGQKQNEADIARKFMDYPLRRIQKCAQIEIMEAEAKPNSGKSSRRLKISIIKMDLGPSGLSA